MKQLMTIALLALMGWGCGTTDAPAKDPREELLTHRLAKARVDILLGCRDSKREQDSIHVVYLRCRKSGYESAEAFVSVLEGYAASKDCDALAALLSRRDFSSAEKVQAQTDSMMLRARVSVLRDKMSELEAFDLAGCEGSADKVLAGAMMLQECREAASEALKSDKKEMKSMGEAMRKALRRIQPSMLPKMRKMWVDAAKEGLWEQDIEVRCLGANSGTIDFVGATFAANANIKATQETLSDAMHTLRFKRSQYKWYRGEDEYTYYALKTPSDSDVD